MTVTVLPKPWSASGRTVREYTHAPGTTTHVVLNETEHVAVSSTSACVGGLAMGLSTVAGAQADLLDLGAPPEGPIVEGVLSGDPFRELVDLMLLAERGRLTASPLEFNGAYAPSLLRLLTHERLLQVVESLIFRARPRYAVRTEALEMPRGRLHERSLVYSLVTGTPWVESTFDELTIDTPILQVVASALRVIASERLPRRIAALRPGLQSRAVHMHRHLAGVSQVDRERALLLAERLWLSPLDRMWQPAVDAALPVLRDRAVTPQDDLDPTEAILVHVSTEKFWEQCLELALGTYFKGLAVGRDAQPGDGVSVPAAWASPLAGSSQRDEPANKSFPDFMFRSEGRVVIADAKYKLGAGGTPSSQDAYQLFTYSHLATLDGRASDFALLMYPTRGTGRSAQVKLERMRDRGYPLWLMYLPFPTRLDLQTPSRWSAFVAREARTIRDFSLDWIPLRGPASADSE